MTGPFAGRQVVILASIDWSSAWQRHQAWAAAFAAQGAEVFFVENTGFRDLRPADLGRVAARLARLWRPRGRTTSPPPKGVRVVAPLVLPPTRPLFRVANAVYLLPLLVRRLRRKGLRPGCVAFAYLPTATTLRLLDLLEPEWTVYDCVDNFSGHPTPPPDLRDTEDALLARADTVLTTASTLFADKKGRHADVHLIHHGAEPAFLGAPRPAGPIRSLCYFGTVWGALDYDAVARLAEGGWRVTLAGPVKEPPPPLPPGVHFAPPVAHAKLPAFLAGFDALLLPYRRSEYNKGVVPAKLYECLATGKPVLASALPSLDEYAPLLYMARSADEFPALARRAQAEDDAGRSAARIAAARAHTTDAQARRVAELSSGSGRRRASRPEARLEKGEAFLRGFSWIASLFAGARLSTFLVQLVGARSLGPAVYGTAHMVTAVASIAQVTPMLGFPLAVSHFTASTRDELLRGRLAATGLIVFALWAAACAAAAALLGPALTAASGLSSEAWTLAAILALATAVHHTIAGALQGLGRFRDRGAVEAAYGVLALLALAAFLALGHTSYRTLVGSYVVGLVGASVLSVSLVFSRVKGGFDASLIPTLLPYAAAGTAHVLSAALIQAPGRLITFHLHDAAQTGVFAAYFACTVQVALAVSNMLQAVLLPLASDPERRGTDWRALRDSVPALLVGGWAVFSAVAAVALTLLGRGYPLRADWVLAFGAAASLVCAHGAAATLFFSRGSAGLKDASLGALLAGIGNLLANLALTPRYGTTGAAASLCIGYGLGLAFYLRRAERVAP